MSVTAWLYTGQFPVDARLDYHVWLGGDAPRVGSYDQCIQYIAGTLTEGQIRHILDAGTGPFALMALKAASAFPSAVVTAVDIHPENIKSARECIARWPSLKERIHC